MKNLVAARVSGNPTLSIADFKTDAWEAKDAADAYHSATAAAHEVFQLIRRDLYLKNLLKFIKPGQKILDLGCGSGIMATMLHDLGYHVVGCDVSEAMLQRFREEMGSRNIELRQGDGFRIPAQDLEFDVIISRMFLQHYPNWDRILKEKARVTKLGGIIYYDFGNLEHLQLAVNIERPEIRFPYSTDVKKSEKFYAACSEATARRIADELNLRVLEIIPTGFLLNNAQFWERCGGDTVEELNKQLHARLQNAEVREFFMFLEEQVIARMPKHISYGNFTVLEKLGAPLSAYGRMKVRIRRLLHG